MENQRTKKKENKENIKNIYINLHKTICNNSDQEKRNIKKKKNFN